MELGLVLFFECFCSCSGNNARESVFCVVSGILLYLLGICVSSVCLPCIFSIFIWNIIEKSLSKKIFIKNRYQTPKTLHKRTKVWISVQDLCISCSPEVPWSLRKGHETPDSLVRVVKKKFEHIDFHIVNGSYKRRHATPPPARKSLEREPNTLLSIH